jgi:trk system potassium uptake protein TrkH
MTSITTVGFNTYSVTKIPHAPLFLLTIFMIIGASPSGTGGGIKSTTITALYAEMKSIISGKSGPILLHNKIPEHRIRLAVGNFIFYITVLITGIYLLLLTENDKNNYDVIFEATSALGTVGLSRGITSGLTILGKVIIIMLMFLGRIGPLSFGMTFMVSKNGNNHNQGNTKEDMVI